MSTQHDLWPSSPLRLRYLDLIYLLSLLIFVPLAAAATTTTTVTGGGGGKLLVVYIDGMRWDYVSNRLHSHYCCPANQEKAAPAAVAQEPTNGLFLMKRVGSFVKRVKPVFPTQCLPNIMSAFTGRFPRHHGMLGNQMYDASSGFHFNYHRQTDRVRHFHSAPARWWEATEPLWETLEKRYGRRASIYNVPTAYELHELRRSASKAAARGKKEKVSGEQSVYYPYTRYMSWVDFERNLLDAIVRLRRNTTDLAVVYTDLLDRMGHSYGPQSVHVENVMKELDSALHMALHELLLEPASANLHMMLLSDHGMQEISQRLTVHLDWYIMRSSVVKVVNDGTFAGIWPEPGRAKQVYSRLRSHQETNKGFRVFWHSDPKIQLYTGHDPHDSRTPPIVVVASHGYVLITREFPFPRDGATGDYPQEGLHGYHPNHADMHTAMMVAGPKVNGGFELSDLNVTEVYQLMCYLLGIPARPHNGTFAKVEPILRSWSDRRASTTGTVTPRASDVAKAAAQGEQRSSGVAVRPDCHISLSFPVLLLIIHLFASSRSKR